MYYYNIKQAWIWTFEDIKWLGMMGLNAINKNFKLPDHGKFNAAEKINFMLVHIPTLIVSAHSLV